MITSDEALDLSPDEKQTLLGLKNSELYRLVKKIMVHLRDQAMTNRIMSADRDSLPVAQGEIRGISMCLGALEAATLQAQKANEVSRITPRPAKSFKQVVPSLKD